MTVEQMRELVDKARREEADFAETLSQLDASIAAAPGEPEYLRMRIDLLEAAYDHVSAWNTRKRLLALRPDDVGNRIALLSRQHRSAMWIAADVFAEMYRALAPEGEQEAAETAEFTWPAGFAQDVAEKAEPEPALDEAREEALAAIQEQEQAYTAQLEADAIDGLMRLMHTHAGDARAARQILDAWNETFIWSPWKYYAMILTARAAHPHDAGFRKDEAKFLVSICDSVEEDTDKAPLGYFDHMISGRFHAITVYQALAALDTVEDLPDDPQLLTQKANLLLALDTYPAASAAFRQAAQAYEKALASATEEEREDLQTRLDDVLRQAAAADGGRAGVYAAHFAQMEEAMAKLHEMPRHFPSPDGEDHISGPIREAESAVSEWKDAARNDPTEPTEAERKSLAEVAAKNAALTAGLVKWDHIELCAMEKEAFAQAPSPWFEVMAAELGETDLELRGWFQNLSNVAALKCEAPGQYWAPPQQDFALTLEATPRITLKRCLTEFSDGTVMLTADSRGSSYWRSGPNVHGFAVFKSTPVTEMVALHRARVAAHLAANPGLAARPMGSLAALEAFENNLRTHSREFRLAHGITDPEIRGMNVKFNDYYAMHLKREVAERLAAMKAVN